MTRQEACKEARRLANETGIPHHVVVMGGSDRAFQPCQQRLPFESRWHGFAIIGTYYPQTREYDEARIVSEAIDEDLANETLRLIGE